MPKRLLTIFFSFIILVGLPGSGAAFGMGLSTSQDNLVVRGTLVCIGKESEEVPCAGTGNTLGLRSVNGEIYLLKKDKLTSTLIEEKRLRSRAFQLTLKKADDSGSYEIVKSQFFRDGKLYDFFYFCDVCNITTHSPGPCMCCRQETEYHEKLAE